jgi:REP element-mobilizing transposase RayT
MNLVSGSYKANGRKKKRVDTRNSWHEFMFVAKCRYKVFSKQKTIDACVEGFRALEALGFEFGKVGFADNHVHFSVNIPKRYSVEDAETMLKSRSSQLIFARIPNFRKRYPRGSFWSGYEHHESIGRDREEAEDYIESQPEHHGIDTAHVQKCVFDFTYVGLAASGDTACSSQI